MTHSSYCVEEHVMDEMKFYPMLMRYCVEVRGGLNLKLGCPQKKSVSCPAGGRNCGQLGGANFFFPNIFFCLVGKYCSFLEKIRFFFAKMKKKSLQLHPAAPSETVFLLVWPYGRSHQQLTNAK